MRNLQILKLEGLAENAKGNKMLHLDLLSDGNVHSNISHLKALIKMNLKMKVLKKFVFMHYLMDVMFLQLQL